MSRREFHFAEGTSNKFWAIEVDGKKHTVHFGRVGTAGQAQVKEFGSEDEAKKSCEKLVAEKVKKGYSEVSDGTKSAGTPVATVARKKAEKEESSAANGTSKPSKHESRVVAVAAAPVIKTDVERTIALNPHDWYWARWRKLKPMPRPTPPSFNLQDAIKQFGRIRMEGYWNWSVDDAALPHGLSRETAHLWFLGFTQERTYKDKPGAIIAELAKDWRSYSGSISLKDVRKRIGAIAGFVPGDVVLPLVNLFTLDELMDLILEEMPVKVPQGWAGQTKEDVDLQLRSSLALTFHKYVAPYLSEQERKTLAEKVRPRLAKVTPPGGAERFAPEAYLAGPLGLHAELAQLVCNLPDDAYADGWSDMNQEPQPLIFGLGTAAQVETEMRRLKLRLRTPTHIRAWFAHTEWRALDLVRDSILSTTGGWSGGGRGTAKENTEELLRVLTLVKAPEAAPYMLEIKLESKAPALARAWLDEEVGNAIAGLVSTAAGRGKLADAALDYLRDTKKKGHEKLIRSLVKEVGGEAAERIKKDVLDFAEKEYAAFDAKSTPAWLKKALDAVAKAKAGKLPAWAAPATLPPIVVEEKRLDEAQTLAVLHALQRTPLGSSDALIDAVKDHADAAFLDAFAWKLFQFWLADGAASKEKWAMGALGLFGGDLSVLKLTPLVRAWPGESQHQRAVFGLECLRAIGSDTALMQLNGIAQKLKFKGLKQKATEFMEAIAKDKGLTRSQLEDRIVPDCDLDERGSRIFDFGPRQFRFVLGPEMKPMLKDPDGKIKTDLPQPGAKDDTARAEQAIADWKLLKKQVKEVATIQAQRLEQAMVTGRRWPLNEFMTLLVKHPLMTNLVRLLVWGAYDRSGKLVDTFRVTEDQTLADAKDGEFKPKGVDSVGVIHPLNLSEDQRSAWGELLSDYEMVPPFPQLGRTIFRLEKNEAKASELTRFKGVKLAAPTLVFGLEKFGWIRGVGMDGGCFDEHSKQFPEAGITAVVHYDGEVGMGYIPPDEMLDIQTCYFVKGMRAPSGYEAKEKKIDLGKVDPLTVSEVLTDLTALAAKAK